MATDIKALGDQIVGLTLLEAKALADYLKETHGIEAAGGVVMAAPAAGAAAAAEEKTEFDVILAEVDPAKKMAVLKEVRAITGLGLGEAKNSEQRLPSSNAHSSLNCSYQSPARECGLLVFFA